MYFNNDNNENNNQFSSMNNFNNDMSSFYSSHATKTTESFDFLEDQQSDWSHAPTIYIAISKPKTNIYLTICAISTIIFIIGSIIFWSIFLSQFAFHAPSGTIEGPFSVIDKLSSEHDEYALDFSREDFGSSTYESSTIVSSSIRNIPATVYYYTLTFSGAKDGYVNCLLETSSQYLCMAMNTSLSLSSISSCEAASNFDGFGKDFEFTMDNEESTVVYLILAVTQAPLGVDSLPLSIKFSNELRISDDDNYQTDFESLFTVGIVGELTVFFVLLLALFAIIKSRKKFDANGQYHTLAPEGSVN